MASLSSNLIAASPQDDDAPPPTGCCCGVFARRRRAKADAVRKRGLAAVMELVSMPSLIQEEAVSCKAILDGMLASPYDLDVQLSGLLNLRHVSTRELLETSSLLMGSSGCSTTAGHPEQSSWRSPEWAHASIRADAEHMGSSASGSGSPAPGKGKGKARMTTSEAPVGAASEVTTAPLVATAGARGSRQSHLGPDADAIDVIVHAMNVGRSHALLQEHACAILAQVATHLVRASLSPKRGGGADVGGGGAGGSGGGGGGGGGAVDEGTRRAMREEAARVRERAFRGGAIAALAAAMRTHGENVDVVHAALVTLWALLDAPGASEGKRQAAEAGVLEMIAAALMQPFPPLKVWNTGRLALCVLIRDEPANRRRAKRAFPRMTFQYSLFMLAL